MFGFGHWELLIILVIALIIFGAGKLPEIGSGIGNAIRNFKKGVAEVEKESLKRLKQVKFLDYFSFKSFFPIFDLRELTRNLIFRLNLPENQTSQKQLINWVIRTSICAVTCSKINPN